MFLLFGLMHQTTFICQNERGQSGIFGYSMRLELSHQSKYVVMSFEITGSDR